MSSLAKLLVISAFSSCLAMLAITSIAIAGTIEAAHEVAPGSSVEATARYQHSELTSFFYVNKYTEVIDELPQGICYEADTLVDTGSEYEIPYSISVDDDVPLAAYDFEIRYHIFSEKNEYTPFDTIHLRLTVNVRHPPTVIEILQSYWPVPVVLFLTLGASIFIFKRYEEYRERIAWRILGMGAIAFGIALGYGALKLVVDGGVPMMPDEIWIIVLIIGIASLYVGFHLVIRGELPQKLGEHAFQTPTARADKPVDYQQSKPVILAVHEENGLIHVHEAVGDPPEITQEEYEHLLEHAEQEKEAAILVPRLKVNGDIVTVPRKFLKEN